MTTSGVQHVNCAFCQLWSTECKQVFSLGIMGLWKGTDIDLLVRPVNLEIFAALTDSIFPLSTAGSSAYGKSRAQRAWGLFQVLKSPFSLLTKGFDGILQLAFSIVLLRNVIIGGITCWAWAMPQTLRVMVVGDKQIMSILITWFNSQAQQKNWHCVCQHKVIKTAVTLRI